MASSSTSYTSFIIGILVLAYLSTFIIFAIIRVLFGVSIQRLWWSGLRRIAFTPSDGIRVDIRGLRLTIHRPTFAQPTWLSVVITELKVTIDLKALGSRKPQKRKAWVHWGQRSTPKLQTPPRTPTKDAAADETEAEPETDTDAEEQRSRTWQRLTELKNKIKRMHRQIQWIRMVDVVAVNSGVFIQDVGYFQLANFTMAVDTRRRTVDRSRLFQHRQAKSDLHRPAEWMLTARSLLFALEGDEANEILDHATLNIHGLLSQKLEGLRDASIALKLGRLSLPYDDLQLCQERVRNRRKHHSRRTVGSKASETSFRDIMQELEKPGSQEEALVQTVSDSKEFVASILRGIQEIQFAVSFIGISKRLRSRAIAKVNAPVYLNMSMKEVGFDVLRLDNGSPAHLMYFSRDDVAHQALVTAISISVGIDDGHDHPERLVYIPMATATIKSTLPSKTITLSRAEAETERNTNILFANLVVTSPSVDLDPKHLPFILGVIRSRRDKPRTSLSSPKAHRHHLISRLLPKASVKISIHEPVARVSLPCMDVKRRGTGDFDLLISAMSSMSFEVESSHSAGPDLHYSLSSTLRLTSHQLYYQTASSEKHDLLLTDSLEVQAKVTASPELAVIVTGNFQRFCLLMVRPEISEGVRQIVAQLRADILRTHANGSPAQPSFLRRLPSWLLVVQLQGSDFNIEVAGIDEKVSPNCRGTALRLESWTAEYKADRHDETLSKPTRRRAVSRSIHSDDVFLRPMSPSPHRSKQGSHTDHRRLAIHIHNLEAFVIESADTWEPESFVSLPRFEVALSTSSDHTGQVLHINSLAKALFVQYSLSRHFACGVAAMVLVKTFTHTDPVPITPTVQMDIPSPLDNVPISPPRTPTHRPEIITVDFKAGLVQIKGTMPQEPNLMVQIFGIEAGRHRWSTPFARARMLRMYADSPTVKNTWARIVSVRGLKVDFRHSKRKVGNNYVDDRSIDIGSEAIRIGVPHQFVAHKIFDNITNIVKTSEQLHHRFKTGTEEYILKKSPVGPKHVPKITFRSAAFLFEIEDGPFDWKLSTIYLNGLNEQKQRLAREEAFRLKKKKMEDDAIQAQRPKDSRSKSAHPVGRGRNHRRQNSEGPAKSKSNSRSPEEQTSKRRSRTSNGDHRQLRYDATGSIKLSDKIKRSVDEAKEVLDKFNADSWKKRINSAYQFQKQGSQDFRALVWGLDDTEDEEQDEQILAIPRRPALMAVLVSDLNVVIDKPSFPLPDLPLFMNRMGKGMPLDMEYSLLIPMHLNVAMGEARMTLRDYPLPVLHVPAIRPGQSPRLPSLSMCTNFVIAEEFRDSESIRHVKVVVVRPELDGQGKPHGGLEVDVRRTVSAVKTYSDITADVNTSLPTRITWGTSYQPAIQDMMQVIENFTKPPVDPSERVGFWDKIRLTFHSRIKVSWKGDGDVHLVLKGSRDPYNVTGSGAGFVMCWRNDVVWRIAEDKDPTKFMTVDSGEYVLAVPDFSRYARRNFDNESDDTSIASGSSYASGGRFKKTAMKLSGNVRWLAGLVFERNTDTGRSFEFKPHYEVALKNPRYAKAVNGKKWDAFTGFRSHHIHLSVAIAAPVDRDWTVTNLKPSTNYNSVHLTPRFFSHFFDWWSLFSGVMSLPIRQGNLFGGVEKSSKKFGRHLATIKYNLLLAPLYLSHIYKHKDAEEYGENFTYATGLKLKLDSFMLDMHQRREEFTSHVTSAQGKVQTTKSTAMKINKAQLDFISADVRAVSAKISGTGIDDIDNADDDRLAGFDQSVPRADLSCFIIPDNDTGWVDMDDFVELDWILPADTNPETKILPLAFSPRFTYFRNTDHNDVINGDSNRSSPFGNEDTHTCVMSQRNDPRRVQCDLIQERLERIAEQLSHNTRRVGDYQLKVIRSSSDPAVQDDLNSRLRAFQEHQETLLLKQTFLAEMHKTLLSRLEDNDRCAVPDNEHYDDAFFEAPEEYDAMDPEVSGMDSAPLGEEINDFNNRFIIHNAQLKWNNSLRDIILRYIHQVGQRRGFVYYMSRRAVKFILDIVDEQKKKDSATTTNTRHNDSETASMLTPPVTKDDENEINDRIAALLQDKERIVEAFDPEMDDNDQNSSIGGPDDEISRDFTAQNAYHVRLIAPQIQLQSEKNTKSAILVTSKGMQLKVIQIMDKDRLTDEVSGLVQRRFTAGMDSVQMYVTSTSSFSSEVLEMYSANRYGAKAGSSWPPWVPLEVMFDFNRDPYGFMRVVKRTSATLRYDKFNTLRLKYNDDVTTGQGSPDDDDNRMDHLHVNFPQLHAICDSRQYYAMYVMVLDLLLYSEPLEKTRSEKLEKIMLASDFTDLSDAPGVVIKLQEKIRTMQEIKMLFQINERTLSRQQWRDRILLEQDLAACEEELFFIMKAITTSQQRVDEREKYQQATGMLKWEIVAKELIWHLLRNRDEHLIELQLRNAVYNRVDNSDGSNDNTMEIGDILGYNLLDDATYPVIIAPFEDKSPNSKTEKAADDKHALETRAPKKGNTVTVHWFMLEAIAGIPVVERFEVNIHPLKVQLEREVGMKVFEYIFPASSSESDNEKDHSPFLVKRMLPSAQEEDGEPDDDHSLTESTFKPSQHLPPDDGLTGAGHLSLRLEPTMTLRNSKRPKSADRNKTLHGSHSDFIRFRHGAHKDTSSNDLRKFVARTRRDPSSSDTNSLRPPMSGRTPSTASVATNNTNSDKETDFRKRFALNRSNSATTLKQNGNRKSAGKSDDINEMIGRAAKYMTLAYIKIPSMVLCLSYKGKGQRDLLDVHDFVFRMPPLEYRNKTWSNMDLFLQLKKEVGKALLGHTGAIISNKIAHRGPGRQEKSRLRELASSSILLGTPTSLSSSATPSTKDNISESTLDDESGTDDDDARPSFTSQRPESAHSGYHGSTGSSSLRSSLNGGARDTSERRPWTSSGLSAGPGSPNSGIEKARSVAGSERSRQSSMSRKLPSLGQRSALRESVVSEEAPHSTDDTVRRRTKMLPKFLRKDKDEGSH
ncbi:hypothetical protein FKW77_005587 [Venturia effusa]|uniref:FMP27 GFWDK domain-containing protein n=1 Tax=Venturia effusa TaxID=50376 RepID=A0A517LKG5_9PEZI|nr:hypothetical protein FKW77_005587 [Venturia effusa]